MRKRKKETTQEKPEENLTEAKGQSNARTKKCLEVQEVAARVFLYLVLHVYSMIYHDAFSSCSFDFKSILVKKKKFGAY